MEQQKETLRLSSKLAVNVVYEDRYLMAIDKPTAYLVAPVHWEHTSRNIMLMLREGVERNVPWARRRKLRFLTNVHRIDADTSGVLLLAKSHHALSEMTSRFIERKVEKLYLVLVEGSPKADKFSCSEPIGKHGTIANIMMIDKKQGRDAHTDFEVLERLGNYTLLRVEPTTGRTHQIRVHLKWLGLPVVSDPLYGKNAIIRVRKPLPNEPVEEAPPQPIDRLALHAWQLRFDHPLMKKFVEIEAPLPKDMVRALEKLRRKK
jgi:23S rRNA pseudouridine1911/1915/1917 synthase